MDGIYHLVRAFPNEEVVHEEGDVDPLRDIGIINNELILKDLKHIEKVFEDIKTRMKRKKEKRGRRERKEEEERDSTDYIALVLYHIQC